MPAGALLAIALVAAVADWAIVWSDDMRSRALERVLKPAVMVILLLAVVAWPQDARPPALVRVLLAMALVASLAGDILLLPPGRFRGGLVAFLVGHVAYTLAFAQLDGSIPWLLAGIATAAVMTLTAGTRMLTAARSSGMRGAVAAYIAVISLMAITATRTGVPAAVLGAWLLVASDAMLGFGQFVVARCADGRAPRPLRMGVITTYHVGQVLLALALLGV